LIGEDGYFAANPIHGALYILVALTLTMFSMKGETMAAAGLVCSA
jgi:hypothetical protein